MTCKSVILSLPPLWAITKWWTADRLTTGYFSL
jgi:hypothetical protein